MRTAPSVPLPPNLRVQTRMPWGQPGSRLLQSRWVRRCCGNGVTQGRRRHGPDCGTGLAGPARALLCVRRPAPWAQLRQRLHGRIQTSCSPCACMRPIACRATCQGMGRGQRASGWGLRGLCRGGRTCSGDVRVLLGGAERGSSAMGPGSDDRGVPLVPAPELPNSGAGRAEGQRARKLGRNAQFLWGACKARGSAPQGRSTRSMVRRCCHLSGLRILALLTRNDEHTHASDQE